MYLNKKTVIHIADTATNLKNALFIRSKSTGDLWQSFLTLWVTVYSGCPGRIRLNTGSSFISKKFWNDAKAVLVVLRFSETESHNAIGQRDCYDHTIKRIINITFPAHLRLTDTQIFRLSIKYFQDTMSPYALFLSLLIFRVFTCFTCPSL